MMAYIFNAMTHLAIDIRLMAFKFFDLVVQYYPPSFFNYAEKILQNFEDILRNNQFYLQDKGKLRNALACLVNCLLLLPCNKRDVESNEEKAAEKRILHGYEPDSPSKSAGFSFIFHKLRDLVAVLVNCFQDFVPLAHSLPVLDSQSYDCMLSIVQSIDLAVMFYVRWIPKSASLYGVADAAIWDQTLSSVLIKKLFIVFPLNSTHHLSAKGDDKYFVLNILITKIFFHLTEFSWPPSDLLEKYLAFIEDALLGKICRDMRTGKPFQERNLISLLSFIPKLVSQLAGDWRSRLVQAFTKTFKDCNPESSLKLACLSTIQKMLVPEEEVPLQFASDPTTLDYQIAWMRELPKLLVALGDKHPSSSQAVLRLQLQLGQRSSSSSSLEWEYNQMQFALGDLYSTCQGGHTCYGPFVRLPRDCQELAVCCLYYFSCLESIFLKSIASCCLCDDLDPSVLFRIIEVLHSAFQVGRVQITDHISFFITLLSHFRVFPESDVKISNLGTFKSMTSAIDSCLSQMGDKPLVFQILENIIIEQISSKLPLDNTCAMLRILVSLDTKPTRLSEPSIITLSNFLPGYLIDVVLCIPENHDKAMKSTQICSCRFYLLPCFFLFDRSHKLLSLVLTLMGSLIKSSYSLHSGPTQYTAERASRVDAMVSVLLLMHKDVKLRKILSSSKTEINYFSQNLYHLQASKGKNMKLEERHRIQCALDRLKVVTSTS
ncbi:testis-expressed protein 10 homolog isoform X2 [Tripterygium wilfordii]|nr:testis-expressed protein 10 homolog isoform X2 [Tripterygium wilfordii]